MSLGNGGEFRNPWLARATKYSAACPSPRILSAKSCDVEGALSPSSASRQVSRLLGSPWIVGSGKLPGIAGGDDPQDPLVQPRSMFCAESGDHWDGLAVPVMTESGETISHRTHNLLQFWNVVESIATLTTDLSVFGMLLVGDKSFWVNAPVRREVVSVLMMESHHTKPYVSLY